jgi:hypothetical protein
MEMVTPTMQAGQDSDGGVGGLWTLEAQRKCVRCMQGVCCGFCTTFNDSAPSTEFGALQAVVDVFQQCQSFVEMGTVRCCPLGRTVA